MRVLSQLLCFAAVAMPFAAGAQTPTLAALRDFARPLLIFAGGHDARVEAQYAELAAHAAEAQQRDLRILLLSASHTHRHNDARSLESSVPAKEQARIRQQFRVAPDEFAVILIGKDGGEKLRAGSPIPWSRLATTIDAMPMRRDEMKRQRQ